MFILSFLYTYKEPIKFQKSNAITELIAAPYKQYLGINIKFKITLIKTDIKIKRPKIFPLFVINK